MVPPSEGGPGRDAPLVLIEANCGRWHGQVCLWARERESETGGRHACWLLTLASHPSFFVVQP